jgi:hypothetical protein
METVNKVELENAIPGELASVLGLKTDELFREGLKSLIRDKKSPHCEKGWKSCPDTGFRRFQS